MRTIKNLFAAAALTAAAACAASCGSAKQFLVTSTSENLTVLTKITESETQLGLSASGGYGYDGLLLTIRDQSGYSNIYKKDNPLSPAMVQLTSGSNYNSDPVLCLATGRIAYKKNTAGASADIYMISLSNNTAMIPVTETGNYNEWAPSFSKDGGIIAYHKTKGGMYTLDSEIWVRNLQTRENMMLGTGMFPKISPDGTKILYCKYNGPGECHIWVMNTDGSNAQQLTGGKKEFAEKPCWSPDGKHIVFQCQTEQKMDYDLYIMNADGTELKQITNNECFDGNPYWGPDNQIYFTSDRGGASGAYQIWRFNYRP